MTRNAINDSLWSVSLVLQIGLLALVFLRDLAGRLPSFTVLLVFYPLRAAALFFLSGHMAADDYTAMYRGLAVLGLLLPIIVAAEISLRLWSGLGRAQWGLLLVPVVAWLGAMWLWSILPIKGPLRPDRVEMFGSLLMILLFGFALKARTTGILRKVIGGLATFGIVDLMATAGKGFAAAHRDADTFAGWSYASSGVYLLVVLFWMVALRPDARE